MKKVIFFDLDETLIQTSKAENELFSRMVEEFKIEHDGNLMEIFFAYAEDLMPKLSQYEEIDQLGIGPTDYFYLEDFSYIKKDEIMAYRKNVCELFLADKRIKSIKAGWEEISAFLLKNWLELHQAFDGIYDSLLRLRKKYMLCMLTNGIIEIQKKKLEISNMRAYFDHIFISGEFGIGKPNPDIYRRCLKICGKNADKTLMVGDNLENDVLAPINVGMKGIYLNWGRKVPEGIVHCADLDKLEELIEDGMEN